MAGLASLADLRAHLNLDAGSSVDEDELADTLEAASDLVVSMVGSFDAVAVTESVAVHGGTALLSRAPSGAVTVADYFGNVVSGASVNTAARLLYLPPVYGPVTVTYSAGDGRVPAGVRLATLIIAAHLFETQRRPGFTASTPVGFGGVDGVPDSSFVPRGFAIPHRAEELLRPFMQSGQVA